MRVKHAPGHESGDLGIAAVLFEVGGIPAPPGAALAAHIHDKVGIANIAPQQPVIRMAAPTAITDIFNNASQWFRKATWQ